MVKSGIQLHTILLNAKVSSMLPRSPARQSWPCRTQKARLHEVFSVFMKVYRQKTWKHPSGHTHNCGGSLESSWNVCSCVSWRDAVPSGLVLQVHWFLSEKTEKWVSFHFTPKAQIGCFYPAAKEISETQTFLRLGITWHLVMFPPVVGHNISRLSDTL